MSSESEMIGHKTIEGWHHIWEICKHPKPSYGFREEYYYDRHNHILTADNIEHWNAGSTVNLRKDCVRLRRHASMIYPYSKDGDIIVRGGVLQGICVWERQELFVLKLSDSSTPVLRRAGVHDFWGTVAEFPCHRVFGGMAISTLNKHAGVDLRVENFLVEHRLYKKVHNLLRERVTASDNHHIDTLGIFYVALLLKAMFIFEREAM